MEKSLYKGKSAFTDISHMFVCFFFNSGYITVTWLQIIFLLVQRQAAHPLNLNIKKSAPLDSVQFNHFFLSVV